MLTKAISNKIVITIRNYYNYTALKQFKSLLNKKKEVRSNFSKYFFRNKNPNQKLGINILICLFYIVLINCYLLTYLLFCGAGILHVINYRNFMTSHSHFNNEDVDQISLQDEKKTFRDEVKRRLRQLENLHLENESKVLFLQLL